MAYAGNHTPQGSPDGDTGNNGSSNHVWGTVLNRGLPITTAGTSGSDCSPSSEAKWLSLGEEMNCIFEGFFNAIDSATSSLFSDPYLFKSRTEAANTSEMPSSRNQAATNHSSTNQPLRIQATTNQASANQDCRKHADKRGFKTA